MSAGLSSLQQRVSEFVEEHGLEAPIQARTLDLVSEAGELAKEVLKGTKYGGQKFEPPQGWEDELGDVFFALVCLANSTGVDLETTLESALRKYRGRLGSRSDAGSGR
jgi:NTP pyrophosphatase (non-canonical NTP hydrolase)